MVIHTLYVCHKVLEGLICGAGQGKGEMANLEGGQHLTTGKAVRRLEAGLLCMDEPLAPGQVCMAVIC